MPKWFKGKGNETWAESLDYVYKGTLIYLGVGILYTAVTMIAAFYLTLGGLVMTLLDVVLSLATMAGYVIALKGCVMMEYSMPDFLDRKYLYRYGMAMAIALAVCVLNMFGIAFGSFLGLLSILLYFIAFHGLRKSPTQGEGARAGFSKLFNAQWLNIVAAILGTFAIAMMGWIGIFVHIALSVLVLWLMLKGWKEVQTSPPLAAAPAEPAVSAESA